MENRTELSEWGEFNLIDHLTAPAAEIQHASTIQGVGDDAAVIDVGDRYQLVTTDMLVEGIHFDLAYTPLMHLGYKAAIVNFSDIYAMNGSVTQLTVSIAVSNRFSVEAIQELYKGIHKACELYGVDLVGGDTSSSTSGLFISVTAIGEVEKEAIVYRRGGKENELLVVTGDLGAAYMGLQLLEREKAVFQSHPSVQPEFEQADYLLERQLKPEARKDVVRFFKEVGVLPTSMIDISDGLASELLHLCKSGELGCTVYDEKLPIDQQTYNAASDFELAPSTCALNGGEDYELLFSIAQRDVEQFADNHHFTIVGHYTDAASGCHVVDSSGRLVALEAQGWNHFQGK